MNKKMDTDIFKIVYETGITLLDAEVEYYKNSEADEDEDPNEHKREMRKVIRDIKSAKRDIQNGKIEIFYNPFQAYSISSAMVQDIDEAELVAALPEDLVSTVLSLPSKVLSTQTFKDELQNMKAMYSLLISDANEAHNCILQTGRLLSKSEYEKIKAFAEEKLEALDRFTPEKENYKEMFPLEFMSFDFYDDVNIGDVSLSPTQYFYQVLIPLLLVRYSKYLETKNPNYAISTMAIRYYSTHRVIFKYDFEKMENFIICQEYSADPDDFVEIANGKLGPTIKKLPVQIRKEIELWTTMITHKSAFEKVKNLIQEVAKRNEVDEMYI